MKYLIPRLVLLSLIAVDIAVANRPAEAAQPNILFILTDDQGHGDLGRHGHPRLKTPHLDALHDESVRLTDFQVAASCSPTRASLLTGIHHLRLGVTHTIPPREHLSLEATLLPQVLKTAGYRTACIGKWHLGHDGHYAPGQRGFDVSFDQQEPIKEGMFREDVLFDRALRFMGEPAAQPFFCYLATHSPHAPLSAPESFIAPYRGQMTDQQATFLGMVANIDANVGRVRAWLVEKKLAENTIIVLMNDNGGTWGLDLHNSGMRGHKATPWPGGSRAMSFWHWPGRWQPRDVAALTAHVDVFPTLAELGGADISAETASKLDGRSLLPLLEGRSDAWFEERMVFQHVVRWPSGKAKAQRENNAGVRWRNYLLVRSRHRPPPAADTEIPFTVNHEFHRAGTPGNDWALYDVHADPGCEKPLTTEQPALTMKLKSAYLTWWDEAYPEMIRNAGDAPLTGLPGQREK
jgi:arylsulfatase A-like enzyme